MKTTRITALAALSVLAMSNSCEHKGDAAPEPAGTCTRTGYVIGVTPCTGNGLIIALESPRDTVYTYNLPAEIFTYTPDLPPSGRNDGLFAPSVRAGSKFTLGYKLVPDAERTLMLCQHNIITQPFRDMTRNQEVTITCASKRN